MRIIKTECSSSTLDPLLGYLFLARNEREFPPIQSFGIYFSRHGYLWTWDVATWMDHPGFLETEAWFLETARSSR
jgi:hypothetical protein